MDDNEIEIWTRESFLENMINKNGKEILNVLRDLWETLTDRDCEYSVIHLNEKEFR
jgi:hypothetical protein